MGTIPYLQYYHFIAEVVIYFSAVLCFEGNLLNALIWACALLFLHGAVNGQYLRLCEVRRKR